MSGHSKWSTIKRQKGVTDAKRGQAFTKAASIITIAAKEGGGNPETNFKLRLATEAAKNINMPKANIEKAIARGVGGEKGGVQLQEVTYEGFGPNGVAVLVEAVTDNKSRTAQEVRSALERSGGRLGGPGSVTHFFKQVGEINVQFEEGLDPDQVLLGAAESGAEDAEISNNQAIVYCKPLEIEKVKKELAEKNLKVASAKISRKPISTINIDDEKIADQVLSLVNKLEDLQDVQTVYANFDISEEVLERNAEGIK